MLDNLTTCITLKIFMLLFLIMHINVWVSRVTRGSRSTGAGFKNSFEFAEVSSRNSDLPRCFLVICCARAQTQGFYEVYQVLSAAKHS